MVLGQPLVRMHCDDRHVVWGCVLRPGQPWMQSADAVKVQCHARGRLSALSTQAKGRVCKLPWYGCSVPQAWLSVGRRLVPATQPGLDTEIEGGLTALCVC